jgi:hypothetical protein
MATRTSSKERPYRCQLCDVALAEDQLGFVCQHVAHGTMVTFVADAPTPEAPRPDLACTACARAIEGRKKGAEANAQIHVVCARCYRAAIARNVRDFSAADEAQGFVLVKRARYDRVSPRDAPLRVGPLFAGRELKLGFSPIPSTAPISLERMWVRVSCVLPRGVLHGVLANDPQLFKRRTLKAGDTVEFTVGHVLEIERKPVLPEAPPKRAAKKAKTKTAKKSKTAKKKPARRRTPKRRTRA